MSKENSPRSPRDGPPKSPRGGDSEKGSLNSPRGTPKPTLPLERALTPSEKQALKKGRRTSYSGDLSSPTELWHEHVVSPTTIAKSNVEIDLDKGKVEGLPLAELLHWLYFNESGMGNVRASPKLKAKGTKIPVTIEIKDGDAKRHAELHKSLRRKNAKEKALAFSSLLEVSAVTVRFEVKVKNQSGGTNDSRALATELTKGPSSEDLGDKEGDKKEKKEKKKKEKEKKVEEHDKKEHEKKEENDKEDEKGRKGTKKVDIEVDHKKGEQKKAEGTEKKEDNEADKMSEKERAAAERRKKLTAMANRPQLVRTPSQNGGKEEGSIKPASAAVAEVQQQSNQSNFRKTFSLVDVKTFFQMKGHDDKKRQQRSVKKKSPLAATTTAAGSDGDKATKEDKKKKGNFTLIPSGLRHVWSEEELSTEKEKPKEGKDSAVKEHKEAKVERSPRSSGDEKSKPKPAEKKKKKPKTVRTKKKSESESDRDKGHKEEKTPEESKQKGEEKEDEKENEVEYHEEKEPEKEREAVSALDKEPIPQYTIVSPKQNWESLPMKKEKKYKSVSLPARLVETTTRHGESLLYYVKEYDSFSGVGSWAPITMKEYSNLVQKISIALLTLQLPVGATVAIIAANSLDWIAFYMATMSVGAIPVPLSTILPSKEVLSLVQHSKCSMVAVDDTTLYSELINSPTVLDRVKHIILLNKPKSSTSSHSNITPPAAPPPGLTLLTWKDFMSLGSDDPVLEAEVSARTEALEGSAVAMIYYTLGTTGPPKGVLLSHENLLSTACSLHTLLAINEADCMLQFLPFSHITSLLLAVCLPIVSRLRIYLAESIKQLSGNLKEVQPTLQFAPPEFWMKLYHSLSSIAALGTPLGPGQKWALLSAVGLSRLRYATFGYAHLAKEVISYLDYLGIKICEAYGMAETSGAAFINTLEKSKAGTCGQALPGMKIKISEGRIYLSGPNVFLGYHENTEATAQVLVDGFFESGDQGSLDDEGFLTLHGREAHALNTSAGQLVHPSILEDQLKLSTLINQAVVFGEGRPYLTAIISLNPNEINRIAKEKGLQPKLLYKAPHFNAITALIQRHVILVNKKIPKGQPIIKRFTVLRKQFSVDNGELTPSMQVKRDVVAEHYAADLDKMYAGVPLVNVKKEQEKEKEKEPEEKKQETKGEENQNEDTKKGDDGKKDSTDRPKDVDEDKKHKHHKKGKKKHKDISEQHVDKKEGEEEKEQEKEQKKKKHHHHEKKPPSEGGGNAESGDSPEPGLAVINEGMGDAAAASKHEEVKEESNATQKKEKEQQGEQKGNDKEIQKDGEEKQEDKEHKEPRHASPRKEKEDRDDDSDDEEVDKEKAKEDEERAMGRRNRTADESSNSSTDPKTVSGGASVAAAGSGRGGNDRENESIDEDGKGEKKDSEDKEKEEEKEKGQEQENDKEKEKEEEKEEEKEKEKKDNEREQKAEEKGKGDVLQQRGFVFKQAQIPQQQQQQLLQSHQSQSHPTGPKKGSFLGTIAMYNKLAQEPPQTPAPAKLTIVEKRPNSSPSLVLRPPNPNPTPTQNPHTPLTPGGNNNSNHLVYKNLARFNAAAPATTTTTTTTATPPPARKLPAATSVGEKIKRLSSQGQQQQAQQPPNAESSKSPRELIGRPVVSESPFRQQAKPKPAQENKKDATAPAPSHPTTSLPSPPLSPNPSNNNNSNAQPPSEPLFNSESANERQELGEEGQGS